MSMFLLFIAVGILAVAGILFFAISHIMNRSAENVHQSEMSSASRLKLKNLKAAIERLERLTEQYQNDPAIKVLGNEALETSYLVRREATKLAVTRDQMLDMTRRTENKGATEIINQIDAKIDAAALSIDDLTLKFAKQAGSPELSVDDTELQQLIGRLQNLGQSFEEVRDTVSEEQK